MRTYTRCAVAVVLAVTVIPCAGAGDREPVVTLALARERVLELNPGIEAVSYRLAAAESAIRQADRLPNPSVELEVENLGGDLPTTGEHETTLVVGQTIELAGKRRLRVAEAEAARALTAMDGAATRRELLHLVDRAFVGLLAAQERLAIAVDSEATAAEVERAVQHLVEAGEVSPIELPRAESEVALAAAERVRGEADVRSAAILLAGLWAGKRLPSAAGDLATLIELPHGWRQGMDTAVLPDVHRWQLVAERDAAVAALERAAATPDLDIAAGYRRFAGTDEHTFVLGVGLSVPLWDRRRDAAAEAEALAGAARRQRDAAHAEVATRLDAAATELELTEREVSLVADEVLPRAREVFDAVAVGYSLGELPLLDVLEVRRTLFSARLRLVDALERQALARADVLRWLPGDPAGLGETP